MQGRVLIIAGSDSSGGAGIQADIKTVTALGGYAMTAITALTAQNTLGVTGIHPVPADFLHLQIAACLNDIGADTIKTGMLHSAEVITTIVESLHNCKAPLVVDPVMIAKGDAPLIQQAAIQSLQSDLLPLAALVTPNIPEAEILSGINIRNKTDMQHAAKAILKHGPKAVLIKGGHLDSGLITDILLTDSHMLEYTNPRIETRHTHGTGCSLASAIATGLAQGKKLKDAVEIANQYVYEAIRTAPGFGGGHGPLNHSWTLGSKQNKKDKAA
ncbi:MAG: bifunctional hydroxymethylpyrimidine kinase/phosphomethylpyrimidine kinase [Alphaproteobacteria bacterium]|nr:MAG: bifunctional hydroxymethylpyrimidine kinase/phosphomethylpyrimidine kinase [Alphaproteobacteria bacterium]